MQNLHVCKICVYANLGHVYTALVYKFKKIRGMTDFSDQFRKIIMRYKCIGYNLNVMRQSACLLIKSVKVDVYAALFNCTPVDWGVRLHDGPDLKLFMLVGWGRGFRLLLGPPGLN